MNAVFPTDCWEHLEQHAGANCSRLRLWQTIISRGLYRCDLLQGQNPERKHLTYVMHILQEKQKNKTKNKLYFDMDVLHKRVMRRAIEQANSELVL